MSRDFSELVDALCQFEGTLLSEAHRCEDALPSRTEVISVVETLRSVIFPGFFGPADLTRDNMKFHMGATLDGVRRTLNEQVRRGLCFGCERKGNPTDCRERAKTITHAFLESLPELRRTLLTDVEAAYEGDPAALSREETIFCYPGVRAITNFRLAHKLHTLGVPILPRMITEHAHSRTGIDIHPGATVGTHFFIDHGTGVVIGETCILGNHVRIYQGVTLGAKSFPLDDKGKPIKGIPRHPILEDDVVVYAGATILGRVTIGSGTVVGGNVWLTHSVPSGSKISQPEAAAESITH